MALNLGSAAFDAIQNLKNSRDWATFRAGLHEAMERQLYQALEVPPEQRQDATGYARGIADVIIALNLNEVGASANRHAKPKLNPRSSRLMGEEGLG
jgi:hypothetical protein